MIALGRAHDGVGRQTGRSVDPHPLAAVHGFFAGAGNVGRIAPPEPGFTSLMRRLIGMRAGTPMDHRLRLPGVLFRWWPEIVVWSPPEEFVDDQRRGPRALRCHRHREAALRAILAPGAA